MNIERSLRMIAGGFVAGSVWLGLYVHPYFLWFTLFVGLNLFQSAFSDWCPMMTILRKAGVRAGRREDRPHENQGVNAGAPGGGATRALDLSAR